MPTKKTATTFLINSDAVSNGGESYHEKWIQRGIAVTSGKEKYFRALNRPKRGDTVLIYVNKIGVVAAGTVLDESARSVVEETVSPNEKIEYHRDVDWHVDLWERPLGYAEVSRLRGATPSSTVTSLIEGEGAILALIDDLAQQLDLEQIEHKHSDAPTDVLALTRARLGQGKYREELLELWDGRCAVTGCGVDAVLRASHAVAWRKASNAERLDPHNGLPLVATLDALFDRGLIGFADDGSMLCSRNLSKEDRAGLGLLAPLRLRQALSDKQKGYLKAHRESYAL